MEWFTVEEIAHLRGLSVKYVYNLASEHQWRRTKTRPRRYHIRDVMDSLPSARTWPE